MRARLLPIPFLLGLAVAVMPALGSNQTVTATGSLQFTPQTVTVNQGETVTWTNAGGVHNVKFDDGSFTDPPSPDGAAWTVARTFASAGTFRYYCVAHGGPGGSGMSGTVVVQAAASPGTTTPSGGSTTPGAIPTTGAPNPSAGQPQGKKKRCISRRKFRIRIREPRGVKIRSASVSVNGKRVPVLERTVAGRTRRTAEVDLRGLPKGTYTARIRALTATGNVLEGTRVYRTCAAKRTPQRLPTL